MAADDNRCCEMVWSGFRHVPCGNRAKVRIDGKGYCGIHDPARIAARRAKSEARRRARREVDRCVEEIRKIERALLAWARTHPDAQEFRDRLAVAEADLRQARAMVAEL